MAKAFIIVVAFSISVLITPSASQAQHRGHVPRVGYLGTSSASLEPELVKAFREGLRDHGYVAIQLQPIEIQRPEDFKDAFARVARQRPDAITMVADRFQLAHRMQILDFVAKTRLPAMYPYRDFVAAGGLMSYGPSYEDLFRRSATYVDKILRGARPSVKTARILGVPIPPSLLLRVDHVFE